MLSRIILFEDLISLNRVGVREGKTRERQAYLREWLILTPGTDETKWLAQVAQTPSPP
jgi:hypothetical protein